MQKPSVDLDAARNLDRNRYTVLFVDDEVENLRVFELAFRRDFKVKTTQDPVEALDMLTDEHIAVVLSDQRMPKMTGVEFLTRVREYDPDTVRMLVTAYGDFETLSSAINEGCIARYIAKPWSPEEMRMNVRQGLESYARDVDRRALIHELEILNRAGSRLCSKLDTRAVHDTLLRIVVRELGFDGATVMMREDDGRVLRAMRSEPRDTEVHKQIEGMKIAIQASETLCEAVEEGRVATVTLGELFDLPTSLRNFAAEIAAEELLFVPLPGRSGALGTLVVDNRRGGPPFDDSNRALLSGLAAQASIAIDNSRLMEDLRQSQELTRRADRLGTLGTLAAGLAHEINNPLVSVGAFLELAPEKRDVDDPEFWEGYHQRACREVERIKSLVQSMSRLGSDPKAIDAPVPVAVDVAELCAEAVRLLEGSLRAGAVEIAIEIDADLSKVRAVPDHLHQVITNLLLNAIHASPQGGRVEVRSANLAGEPRRVAIVVQDWGTGIPPERLERIFDPFFTTKAPDRGAGLGLMIAHRIVTEHHGTIEVESGVGQGSTFRVVLPAA